MENVWGVTLLLVVLAGLHLVLRRVFRPGVSGPPAPCASSSPAPSERESTSTSSRPTENAC